MQNEQIGWVDFVCEGLILDSQTTNEFWDVLEDWGENSINKPCNGLGTYPYPDGRIYVSESKKSFYGQGNYSWPDGMLQWRIQKRQKEWWGKLS